MTLFRQMIGKSALWPGPMIEPGSNVPQISLHADPTGRQGVGTAFLPIS